MLSLLRGEFTGNGQNMLGADPRGPADGMRSAGTAGGFFCASGSHSPPGSKEILVFSAKGVITCKKEKNCFTSVGRMWSGLG